MDRKTALVSVAVAAAISLSVGWWLWRTQPPASPAATGESVPAEKPAPDDGSPSRDAAIAADAAALLPAPPNPAAAPSPAPTSGVAAPAEPLLRDEIAELDRRARTGDASAACRLGAELLRCERARVMQPYTDNVEAQARAIAQRSGVRQEEIDRQIDAALQRQAENAAALARCEGVDESQWPVPARYFHLAAEAGHRPSMLQFLNAERFRADQLFRDPELIPLFRANAPRYFQRLLEDGDPDLLQRVSMTAAMPYDILQDVLPPPWNDPGFAAAMQQQSLLARGITPPAVPLRDPPAPEQLDEAERVYSRYFAPRRPTDEELRRRAATSPYDLEAFRCEEAPHGPASP